MCGINGIVRWKSRIKISEIKNMNKAIKHRGPDDEGAYLDVSQIPSIALGHVRLSILDISKKGHQPMGLCLKTGDVIFEDKYLNNADVIIVFNGEIYNYLELKEKHNLKTLTNTDTEVILRLYAKLGVNCVNEFNGMWAFCIYDKRKNILFFSRDRFGKKPLYYYMDENEFIFSSELKGIVAVKNINKKENLNFSSIDFYFSLGFIPSPYSIYKNVFKLEARQNLILDLKNKKIKKFYYWELPNYEPIYDKKKLISEAKDLLYDAVKIRMRSDVPIGAFLSGGLDSSTVVGVMKEFTDLSKLHTFSIGFEGKYDETPYIKVVVNYFKTQHHHYYFKEKDFEKLIDKYTWIYDEPFGDYSGFPTYKVSEIAKKFVTVVLSGDGGDEIFGGYINHLNAYRLSVLKKVPRFLRKFLFYLLPNKFFIIKEALKISFFRNHEFYSKLLEGIKYKPAIYKQWMENNLLKLLSKSRNNLINAVITNDLLYLTVPDNFLVKVDRASMANSLEVRSPFLDYRFAEFSQKIPVEWKVDLFKTKKLMREIVKDILPDEIINRGKQGFHPPIDKWIFNLNLDYRYITKKLYNNKLIPKDLYEFLIDKVINEKNKLTVEYLIRLFIFYKWVRKWITDF